MKPGHCSTPCTKINSKWSKDLNVRLEPQKYLGKKYSQYIINTGLSNILGGMPPQARKTKAKINKWDYIKLKSFHTAKKFINKLKWQMK